MQLPWLGEYMADRSGIYNANAYRIAMQNTKYNTDGKATITADDEWASKSEWDDMLEQLKKERSEKTLK